MNKLFTLLALGCVGVAGANAATSAAQKMTEINSQKNVLSTEMVEKLLNIDTETLKAARIASRASEEYLGVGMYREALCASVFTNCDQQDIAVDIYQSEDDFGPIYRLDSPYANWDNPYSDVVYDFSGVYDMYIHEFTLDGTVYIWIEDFQTGLNVQSMGDMYLITQVGSLTAGNQGYEAQIMSQYPNCYGTNDDGVMTYPYQMTRINDDGTTTDFVNFLVGFTYVTDGYYAGNNKKTPFVVTLPGVEPPAEVDPFEIYTYLGEGVIYNNIMTPFLQEPADAPYSVGVYCEENNPFYYHIRNAWGEWHDSESKDSDFEFYFPYDQITKTWNTNVAALPMQTTGYNDLYFGEIWILGISTLFVNYSDEFDSYDEFLATYPGNCISIDRSAKRIIFPNETVVYDFDYNDTNQWQFADPSYQFEGYIEFPKDYVIPDAGGAGVESIGSIDENAPVRYFNLQGVELSNPEKGQIVIINQGGKSVK